MRNLQKVKDKKSGVVWNVMMLGMYIDDSDLTNASRIALEITSDLDDVTDLMQENRDAPRVPEMVAELKVINAVAAEFVALVRQTSWHPVQDEFDPSKSLAAVKYLDRALKYKPKRVRQSHRREPTAQVEHPDRHAGDEARMARLRAIRDKHSTRPLEDNAGFRTKAMNYKNVLCYGHTES